jgi:hypothetical protein
MTNLPKVTLVAITDRDYGQTIEAIYKTLEHITPAQVLFFTDVIQFDEKFKNIVIPRFGSWEKYNDFVVKDLYKYIDTEYILLIQHDGYVINGDSWTDEFLQYDYIGAPWAYKDGRNVGNGGFSLRSTKLHKILAEDPMIQITCPEDEIIGRLYRRYLENKGIKFAPENIAHKFSFEMHPPKCRTFGFHNYFHPHYREPIIFKRSGAMGDVIMMEPVMEYFYNKGYRIILDTQHQYFNLFAKHYFPVELLSMIPENDVAAHTARVINLDMAYEVKPRKLALVSYFEMCGVGDSKLRNPKLNFRPTPEVKLFDRYVIIHSDDTAMPHRNVHGFDWENLTEVLEAEGYGVYRVGRGKGTGGRKITTLSENMLAYIISGADFFIGIDSGCAQIAVACGVKSVLFFGSVLPEYRYADMSNIKVIQNLCPVAKDGCYHNVVSTVGQDCEVDVQRPPCITHSTDEVINSILKFIQ